MYLNNKTIYSFFIYSTFVLTHYIKDIFATFVLQEIITNILHKNNVYLSLYLL